MKRYLVVANQTLGGEHLDEEIRTRLAGGPCQFHVLVPATPPQQFATWTEGQALAVAGERLDGALLRFKELGAEATGEVGDVDPLLAIRDTLRERGFDEIILSTLPLGISRWMKQDLLSRLHREIDLPVTHVVAEAEEEAERG